MRRLVDWLLVAYVFAIPWEYSLDLGQPWGNVARLVGLLLLATALLALFDKQRSLPFGWTQSLVLALYLWFCLSAFWSIDQAVTLGKLRAFFQEMMVVFLVAEFARTARQLRWLTRAVVAGCWLLALLSLAQFHSVAAFAEEQARTAAFGQDPNDVARFLDLGMPFAALLARVEQQRILRWAALAYLPTALLATLLTASRGGVLAAAVALGGAAILLLAGRPKLQRASLLALPALLVALWIVVPASVLQRLATIPEQLQGGNLNQRISIWTEGWQAFERAPWLGYGAGNFTLATGLRPEDTAHNTALALLVAGGLIALFLASLIAVRTVHAAFKLAGPLRTALLTALAVFAVTAMVSSQEESRFTWLLVALVLLAHRLQAHAPAELASCFSVEPPPVNSPPAAVQLP